MVKNWIKILVCFIIVLVADLVTKHFLFDVQYYNLIPNFLSVATNYGNDGAAWGMFSGKRIFLIIVSVIMIIAILIFNHYVKNKNTFYCVGIGLILGGAVGNLFDRVFLGYVRDFIFLDFMPNFPTFNFADSCLTIGAIIIGVFIIFMLDKKKD